MCVCKLITDTVITFLNLKLPLGLVDCGMSTFFQLRKFWKHHLYLRPTCSPVYLFVAPGSMPKAAMAAAKVSSSGSM